MIHTNEIPNLPTRDDVKTWWLSNEEAMNLRSENRFGATHRNFTQRGWESEKRYFNNLNPDIHSERFVE